MVWRVAALMLVVGATSMLGYSQSPAQPTPAVKWLRYKNVRIQIPLVWLKDPAIEIESCAIETSRKRKPEVKTTPPVPVPMTAADCVL